MDALRAMANGKWQIVRCRAGSVCGQTHSSSLRERRIVFVGAADESSRWLRLTLASWKACAIRYYKPQNIGLHSEAGLILCRARLKKC